MPPIKVVPGIPTPGIEGTAIPLRQKYRVGVIRGTQKSPNGNNLRKSSQHKGERWKTIRAASRRGTSPLPAHLK